MGTVLKIKVDSDDYVEALEVVEMTEEQIAEIEEVGTECLYNDDALIIKQSIMPERCGAVDESSELYMFFSKGVDQWVYDAFEAGSLRFSPL